MAAYTVPDIPNGLVFKHNTVTYGKVLDFNWSGGSRVNAIPTSTMDTALPGAGEFGGATYIPGEIVDSGELTLTRQFNPDTNPAALRTSAAMELEWAYSGTGTTKAKWAGTGFLTDRTVNGALDEVQTVTEVYKATGIVTVTPQS